jgi:ATP-binding cassette subfamily C (CFTR/MRP) protein 1
MPTPVLLPPSSSHYPISQRYYIPAARELQRIESISRSPIYSKFSEALAGVATIRAFRKEEYFTTTNDGLLQQNAYAYVTQRAAAGWLALRLDMVGVCILTLAGEGPRPGDAGTARQGARHCLFAFSSA